MKMNKVITGVRSVVLIVLILTLQLNAQDVFVTSFETNTLGSINNQDQWEVENGTALVTDSETLVHSGSQGLNFIAENQTLVVSNTSFSGSEPGVSGVVYVDLYVKINSMAVKDFAISGYDKFGGSSKRAFVLEFDTASGSGGMFRIYDGSSKLNIQTYNLNEWNRISTRVDYDHEIYQVIFNGSEAVTASFRENYTPTASGTRQAGIKEYHEMLFNLGYNGATGSVDAAVDDIYVSTTPIADITFPSQKITYTIDIEQPHIGSISVDPDLEEYPDSTQVTVTLTVPDGYKNGGWTGDLSGTELQKTFLITTNMQIGASVVVDPDNPPAQFTITVTQPDTGEIALSPAGGLYYDYTIVTATLSVPVGYLNQGWTGDLSGTELEKTFVVHGDLQIGANVIYDTTPPTVYTVSSASELKATCKGTNLQPGDIVEVADGQYDSGGITVESSGTANKPIVIRAQNIGGAELTGETYFTFRKAAHILLEGFHFTSAKYTVVKLEACNNIRISRNTFQITESEGQNGKWVYIGGYWDDGSLLSHHNRIDHNIFRDKHQLGNFITIDGGSNVSQHDQIDHNYFYNIGPRHDNEMEAIRVGWSELSLTDGFTVIEYNLFEACDGDPEIISVKSCKDTVRYNTIKRSMGTVSLRHGDGSVVHDNFFLGDGKTGTGGVRIYARNHKIYNNYFEGLQGHTWDAAITLTNGDTETGSLSAHWRIDNVTISHNTLVNNFSNIEIGYAKSDNTWKKEPRNVTLANNLVVGNKKDLIAIKTTPTNFTWSGNIMYPQDGVSLGMDAAESEIAIIDPLLVNTNDLWLLSTSSPAIDAALNNYLNISEDVQGQERSGINDVGADEYSTTAITRRPLTPEDVGPKAGNLVSVEMTENVPETLGVFQNYPNPFNPTTTLVYELQSSSNVKLEIYNILGQRVDLLLNKHQAAGTHLIQWHAGKMASGIYFAVLETGLATKTLKMYLLR
ncbi:MAG: T9SS C-terminal target domain-containing protein [Calditrichaeota bacterium]|nr:MAG: T9SS C-terminal target domain-containing protein [Calditrichota bacterium]